jgi:hypothetical protein
MSIFAKLMTIHGLVRGALSRRERRYLPWRGLSLVRGNMNTGERCPPGGVIRQLRYEWYWHPTEWHARRAAVIDPRHCFIVGDGAKTTELNA